MQIESTARRRAHTFNAWAKSKNGRHIHHECGICGEKWVSVTYRGIPPSGCPKCHPPKGFSD